MKLAAMILVMAGLATTVLSIMTSGRRPSKALSLNPTVRAAVSTDEQSSKLTSVIAARLRAITPAPRLKRLEGVIQMVGPTSPYTTDQILIFKFGGGFALGFLGLINFAKNPSLLTLVFLVVGTSAGYVVPEMLVSNRADARREQVQLTLPDAIDQLSVTVRAGLSIDAALIRVAATMRGPLSEELSRVVQDIQFGMSRTDSLQALADRMNMPELSYFVRALIQADNLGVPVSTTLSTQAESMRMQRRLRSEEMAMKLPVKILAPTLLCILPALMLVVLGPAVVNLASNLKL